MGANLASEPIVIFLQIVFGLLVFVLAGIVFLTIYQVTNPKLKKYNKGWLHERSKRNDGGSID